METLQNGFAKFATTTIITKPSELPLSNGTTHLNNLFTEPEIETEQDFGNMDPSRAFVNKVKRLIVKVPFFTFITYFPPVCVFYFVRQTSFLKMKSINLIGKYINVAQINLY